MAAAYLTLTDLQARYLEIRSIATSEPAFVQAWLDSAALRTPLDVWKDFASEAHGALAMHLLAITPFGQQAKLSREDGTSVYGDHRERLEREMGPAAANRVVRGGCPPIGGMIW